MSPRLFAGIGLGEKLLLAGHFMERISDEGSRMGIDSNAFDSGYKILGKAFIFSSGKRNFLKINSRNLHFLQGVRNERKRSQDFDR